MYWKRLVCWWKGHDVDRFTYAVLSTKKYHGHHETRNYLGCTRCGGGSPEEELAYWSDDTRGFIQRHETAFSVIMFIGAFAFGILVITAIAMAGSSYGCEVNGEIMELSSKFNWITGTCYYELDGRWIARNLLTVVDVLK